MCWTPYFLQVVLVAMLDENCTPASVLVLRMGSVADVPGKGERKRGLHFIQTYNLKGVQEVLNMECLKLILNAVDIP